MHQAPHRRHMTNATDPESKFPLHQVLSSVCVVGTAHKRGCRENRTREKDSESLSRLDGNGNTCQRRDCMLTEKHHGPVNDRNGLAEESENISDVSSAAADIDRTRFRPTLPQQGRF